MNLNVHAVHLLSFLRRSDPFRGITWPWRAILGWAKATLANVISGLFCLVATGIRTCVFAWYGMIRYPYTTEASENCKSKVSTGCPKTRVSNETLLTQR